MTEIVNPIHPDIIERLDPEFVAYYNAHSSQFGAHLQHWDPAIRAHPAVPGASEPLKVGLVEDFRLTHCAIRVFWPEDPSKAPESGWPILLYFHGGGWTLGNINSENHFTTTMCQKANCVVVSVDYRLGPEEPYPKAVDDAVEAWQWTLKEAKNTLHGDRSRIAVGGASSGGNLAAIVTHKVATMSDSLPVFQLLVVPAVDNTASVEGPYPSWKENMHTPALTIERMLWFKRNYAPNPEDWTNWDNSPITAPEESFARCPDAWIGVCEIDILRDEGLAYADKLRKAGKNVETRVYEKSPHPIMAMDALEAAPSLPPNTPTTTMSEASVESSKDRIEPEHIASSLEVEELDTNLFRSRTLWAPARARGVFGGQVISQAVVSATKYVDPAFGLHSLHCYFLLSVNPAQPVLYYVNRLREGKSYTTSSIRAVQNGKNVFIMLCSFHKPEPEHPYHQWTRPTNVPRPDELELDFDMHWRLQKETSDEKLKAIYGQIAQERFRSPIICTVTISRTLDSGALTGMMYFKARVSETYGPAFQKCILGYMSDLSFISVAARSLGLKRMGEGSQKLAMSSSLDHSIFYYSDNFDCSDWLLYVVQSPRTGSGRGLVHGQIYKLDGSLIAVTTQEGVVRSGANKETTGKPIASKL